MSWIFDVASLAAATAAFLGGMCRMLLIPVEHLSLLRPLYQYLDRNIGAQRLDRRARTMARLGLIALSALYLFRFGIQTLGFLSVAVIVVEALPMGFRYYWKKMESLDKHLDNWARRPR